MDITSFLLGMKKGKTFTEGYNLDLATAILTRNAEYLGNEKILDTTDFVLADGIKLGSVHQFAFAGFDKVEGIKVADLVLYQPPNVFAGDTSLKYIDITITVEGAALVGVGFWDGSLNGCTALEAVIIRSPNFDFSKVFFHKGSTTEANNNFFVYVPSKNYDAIISNIIDNSDVPASRFRRLEDWPSIQNWEATIS